MRNSRRFPRGLEALQLKRLKSLVERVYTAVPYYRKRWRNRRKAFGHQKSQRFVPPAVYHERGPQTELPLRPLCGAFRKSGENPCVFRTTGKPRSSIHEKRHRCLGGTHGEDALVRRCAQGRRRAQRLWLWPLYRRTRRALRGRKARCGSHPDFRGNSKRQIMIMQDFGSTVLMCTPSYALNLAEIMQEMNVTRRP